MAALPTLPNELLEQIADNLHSHRELSALSRTSKSFHVLLDSMAYERAVEEGVPLLMWAYHSSGQPQARITATTKYLSAGGGDKLDLGWRNADFVGRPKEFWDEAFERLQIENIPLGWRRWELFEKGIVSEIGVLVAQILSPAASMTSDLKHRLEWLQLILDTAQPAVLARVEWYTLAFWMARSFDEETDATLEIFKTIIQHDYFGDSRKKTYPLSYDTPPKFDWHTLSPWLQGFDIDHPEYTSNRDSPLGQLFLPKPQDRRQAPSSGRRNRLAKAFIDHGIANISEIGLIHLMRFSRYPPDAAAHPDEDLFNVVQTVLQGRIDAGGFAADPAEYRSLPSWLSRILLLACLEHDPRLVEFLLEKGADVNVTDGSGKTPIMLAREHEVSQVLLYHPNTDLSILDGSGHNDTLLMAILRYQAAANTDANLPLPPDRERECLTQLEFIIALSPPGTVDQPSEYAEGMLPLALAAAVPGDWKPWLAGVELLLEAGADPNVLVGPDPAAKTWLLHEVLYSTPSEDNERLIELLLMHGADPEKREGNVESVHEGVA